MPHEESRYAADWLRLAQRDLERVGRLLDVHDPALAGFCLQQAVEKFLKAFLLSRGWQLKRIHHLDALKVSRFVRVVPASSLPETAPRGEAPKLRL
jgi:HEPN domain-containing protein